MFAAERIVVVGGDGFCGWPTALDQSARGADVLIIDDFSRRKIDAELGTSSLTPITSIAERVAAWQSTTGRSIRVTELDISTSADWLESVLSDFRPDAVLHFGEQRSAPYSMLSAETSRYTFRRNTIGTYNLLTAIKNTASDAHLVHIGSIGVYGYSTKPWTMPEGYLRVTVPASVAPNDIHEIMHPFEPVSSYHLTKSMDAQMFEFYARTFGLRITDLHQGIVWGSQTVLTIGAPALVNRFDYDAIYGTVVNRFILQAAVGQDLTVYGTGEQTRAFIHIADIVECIDLALRNSPRRGDRVLVRNQVSESMCVADVAKIVADATGAGISCVDNPRIENTSNSLRVDADSYRALGLVARTIGPETVRDEHRIAAQFAHRADRDVILPKSALRS